MLHGTAWHACPLPHLSAWNDVNAVNSSEDCRRQLRPEGIPHAVFDLRRGAVLAGGSFDRNKLLAVHSLWPIKSDYDKTENNDAKRVNTKSSVRRLTWHSCPLVLALRARSTTDHDQQSASFTSGTGGRSGVVFVSTCFTRWAWCNLPVPKTKCSAR